MTEYHVHAPEAGFSGESCGVVFQAGAAVLTDDTPQRLAALAYFRRRDYAVTEVQLESAPAAPQPPAEFNPADHNVADVIAYLADADEDERACVLAAEEAGEARATILKKGASS